jgi:hypothetical protein
MRVNNLQETFLNSNCFIGCLNINCKFLISFNRLQGIVINKYKKKLLHIYTFMLSGDISFTKVMLLVLKVNEFRKFSLFCSAK